MSSIKFIGRTNIRTTSEFQLAAMCRDDAGAAQGGRTVTYALRNADGEWWDDDQQLWVADKTANPMSEPEAVDMVGVYTATLDHNQLSPGRDEMELLCEVLSTGAGNDPTDIVVLSIEHDLMTLPLDDDSYDTDPMDYPARLVDLWRSLKALFTQSNKIDDVTKTMVVYHEDGTSPAMTFDLEDATGQPSVREIFRRIRNT